MGNKIHDFKINFSYSIASLMIFITALIGSGCVGSTFLHDENDQPFGDFGDLHSIPDKPLLPDKQELLRTRKILEQEHNAKAVTNP